MAKRAVCLIRHALVYRREAFIAGLKRAGYAVRDQILEPTSEDVLVIWNRYGTQDNTARYFEQCGARVVVCENGYLGKGWRSGTWIALALGHHAGAGTWVEGGPERWDDLGEKLEPFRVRDTGELIILAQRGIGEKAIACPQNWMNEVQRKYGGRIRQHPANANVCALEEDLKNAVGVITWNSSAALRSLMLGVPVWYAFKCWVGARAAKPLHLLGKEDPNTSEEDRLAMFRSLAWAQWRLDEEIATGKAFEHLLEAA